MPIFADFRRAGRLAAFLIGQTWRFYLASRRVLSGGKQHVAFGLSPPLPIAQFRADNSRLRDAPRRHQRCWCCLGDSEIAGFKSAPYLPGSSGRLRKPSRKTGAGPGRLGADSKSAILGPPTRGLGGKTTPTVLMATWRIAQTQIVGSEPRDGEGGRARKRNAAYLLIKRAYYPDKNARSAR